MENWVARKLGRPLLGWNERKVNWREFGEATKLKTFNQFIERIHIHTHTHKTYYAQNLYENFLKWFDSRSKIQFVIICIEHTSNIRREERESEYAYIETNFELLTMVYKIHVQTFKNTRSFILHSHASIFVFLLNRHHVCMCHPIRKFEKESNEKKTLQQRATKGKDERNWKWKKRWKGWVYGEIS